MYKLNQYFPRDKFAHVLESEMKKNNIKSKELAKKSGLSESFISYLLSAKKGISTSSLVMIEQAFGKKPGYFFEKVCLHTKTSTKLGIRKIDSRRTKNENSSH